MHGYMSRHPFAEDLWPRRIASILEDWDIHEEDGAEIHGPISSWLLHHLLTTLRVRWKAYIPQPLIRTDTLGGDSNDRPDECFPIREFCVVRFTNENARLYRHPSLPCNALSYGDGPGCMYPRTLSIHLHENATPEAIMEENLLETLRLLGALPESPSGNSRIAPGKHVPEVDLWGECPSFQVMLRMVRVHHVRQFPLRISPCLSLLTDGDHLPPKPIAAVYLSFGRGCRLSRTTTKHVRSSRGDLAGHVA